MLSPWYQPPPAAITALLPPSADQAFPRSLNPFGEADGRVFLQGFLTPEETHLLAEKLPLRRKPFLFALCAEAAHEYVMHQWETQQATLFLHDYQERKRQLYQERHTLWKDAEQWRLAPLEDPGVEDLFGESTASLRGHIAERSLQERLFGQELGSRLRYVERSFPFEKPTRVEERFFLVPEEVYQERSMNLHAMIDQWITACPEDAERLHTPHWEALWRNEEELMRRLHYAVSRHWGIMMYYTSGK